MLANRKRPTHQNPNQFYSNLESNIEDQQCQEWRVFPKAKQHKEKNERFKKSYIGHGILEETSKEGVANHISVGKFLGANYLAQKSLPHSDKLIKSNK